MLVSPPLTPNVVTPILPLLRSRLRLLSNPPLVLGLILLVLLRRLLVTRSGSGGLSRLSQLSQQSRVLAQFLVLRLLLFLDGEQRILAHLGGGVANGIGVLDRREGGTRVGRTVRCGEELPVGDKYVKGQCYRPATVTEATEGGKPRVNIPSPHSP